MKTYMYGQGNGWDEGGKDGKRSNVERSWNAFPYKVPRYPGTQSC